MESIEITAPATGGASLVIRGKKRGFFIIHQNAGMVFLQGDDVPAWCITHMQSATRFPWCFLTEEAASAFADDVLPMMDWEAVDVQAPDDIMMVKAIWSSPRPTKEQNAAIWLASKNAAVSCARIPPVNPSQPDRTNDGTHDPRR